MTEPAQLILDLPRLEALGRADFIVGAPNAEAVAWIDRWPDWPRPALALAGPAGSGKSHLGCVWRKRSDAGMIDGAGLTEAGIEMLATAHRALVIEAADAAPERPLLHLHNIAAERGLPLLLIAREPPARWGTALPDLASRLAALPVARILPPDDGLIAAVLKKLFEERQVTPQPEALGYLVSHMERSFAAANRLAAAIDALSIARQRPITVPLVRDVLALDEAAEPLQG
ncbi:MAG TPA: hypothetical protein VKS60_25345 [Stellaceae bacterium]|nr:hypothetical protein [Stellaceae bacterium]